MKARKAKWLAPAVAALFASGLALAETSPYAGLERRDIRTLSQKDMSDLLAGRGAGYALAAELNGHPGPLHVLELAAPLGLTANQRTETQAVFDTMNAEARTIGAEIVAAERALNDAFAKASLDKAALARRSEDIGRLYGRYRAAHLKAHLDMTALLSPQQTALYSRLRGYGSPSSASPHHPGKH